MSSSKVKPALDGYKFGKVIGQGGYGKVYECTSVPMKNKADSFKCHKIVEKVAIKVISKETSNILTYCF